VKRDEFGKNRPLTPRRRSVKRAPIDRGRPLLLVDVDGVISLIGFDPARPPAGRFQSIDGITHLLSASAGACLRRLADRFEAVWCTGWEEKANEYLPWALDLVGPFPFLSFGRAAGRAVHWKLAAIDAYAGQDRALAWIDDAFDESCETWAASRVGSTVLVRTDPAIGINGEHVERLLSWADGLPSQSKLA
jgi:hypothetical protein